MQNKVVIVTGAARGIGLAVARRVVEAGSKVVAVGRDRAALDEAAAELGATESVLVDVADVTIETDVQGMFERAVERFGSVDTVVNNAGAALLRPFVETTLDEWRAQFAVHADGPFLVCREAVRRWRAVGTGGTIVNVASICGTMGAAWATAYSASKAAVLGLTRALARETASHGIRVNAVVPGAVDTTLFHDGTLGAMADRFGTTKDKLLASTLGTIPMKRLLAPDEVARLIWFLASDEARGVTGQAYTIDCGADIHC